MGTADGTPGTLGPSGSPITYLVATTPQAGSDLLTRWLAGSGVAGEPHEYFVPTGGRQWHTLWGVERDWSAYRDFVDAARTHAISPNGVFGATLQWHQLTWLVRVLGGNRASPAPADLLKEAFSGPRYLFVRRRDPQRQAIDCWQAICEGRTHLAASGAARPAPPPPSRSQMTYIRWLEDLLAEQDRRWTEFFAQNGIEPLEILFEDLVEAPRRVCRGVLRFLGVPRPPDGLGRRLPPPRDDLRWATAWAPVYAGARPGLTGPSPSPPWADADRLTGRPPPLPVGGAASDERVLYSCVVDQAPRLQFQSLVWYLTLTELGGVRPEQIVVHAVDGTPVEHLDRLRSLGIDVVTVERYSERNKFANKLRQLESDVVRTADRVVLTDCDLAFCGDMSSHIGGPDLAGSVNDSGLPGYHTWLELARLAGLSGPVEPRRGPKLLRWTYARNLNCGFLVVPGGLLAPLAAAWPRWLEWVLDHCQGFPDASKVIHHALQVSLGLATLEADVPVRQLSPALNLSLIPPSADPVVSSGVDPVVLHYHGRITGEGLLMENGVEVNDRAIASVNGVLADHRQLLAPSLAGWLASR